MNKTPTLTGTLVELDVTNPREVTYWLQHYMDQHGKPPQVLVVNPNAPEFSLPEKFEGLGCTILRKQYIHHPRIAIVGAIR